MVKAKSHTPKLTKKFYPIVSVCTPTFNRRPFIPTMFECFKNQTYPADRMEWIIVDDGTDRIRDLVEGSGIPQIKYFELPKKVSLGRSATICTAKRLVPLLFIWMMMTITHQTASLMRLRN